MSPPVEEPGKISVRVYAKNKRGERGMKKKKLISLLLSAVMAVTVLSGCASQNESAVHNEADNKISISI